MDNWDEEKLREVVKSKHGNPQTTTDIVCKYFIEAVENSKYGWFWACTLLSTFKYLHLLSLLGQSLTQVYRSKWGRVMQI